MRALKQILSLPIASAITAGLLVAAATMLVTLTRPTEYTARIGLLATPAAEAPDTPTNTDFPAVVAQSMAAVVEAAHSPSIVTKASGATNGELSAQEVFDAVSVELVPGSGLARLTVKASSPVVASDVASTIGNELVGQNLGIKCCLRRKMLEQQGFRECGRRRHPLGRRPRKPVAGKAAFSGTQDELPPQIAGHAQGRHGLRE